MTPTGSPKSEIDYHIEGIDFDLAQAEMLSNWIKKTIAAEGQVLESLNFIFCSDEYLHKINVDYLNHDTLTDVITFPYSEINVEGDIFISIDRIRENAINFDTTFETELHRVMIHGVLHLCGYGDKTEAEAQQMRAKEAEYLSKL